MSSVIPEAPIETPWGKLYVDGTKTTLDVNTSPSTGTTGWAAAIGARHRSTHGATTRPMLMRRRSGLGGEPLLDVGIMRFGFGSWRAILRRASAVVVLERARGATRARASSAS